MFQVCLSGRASDYLGEPTPYWWPSRSSFFGIVDLAGIPKDVYYMYQSEWTDTPVLHLFPHWNWKKGETVDVWAYYNQADEVELFLNGESLGVKSKPDDAFHVCWRVPFTPGTLKAVSRRDGKEVLTREIRTAGEPARDHADPRSFRLARRWHGSFIRDRGNTGQRRETWCRMPGEPASLYG